MKNLFSKLLLSKIIQTENGYIKYHNEEGDVWIIDEIEVLTKRQGSGTKLLKLAENDIYKNGGRRIELYAYPINDDMEQFELCDFYHNNGYEDNECYADFSKDL